MKNQILKRINTLARIDALREAREARAEKLKAQNMYIDESTIKQKISYTK